MHSSSYKCFFKYLSALSNICTHIRTGGNQLAQEYFNKQTGELILWIGRTSHSTYWASTALLVDFRGSGRCVFWNKDF